MKHPRRADSNRLEKSPVRFLKPPAIGATLAEREANRVSRHHAEPNARSRARFLGAALLALSAAAQPTAAPLEIRIDAARRHQVVAGWGVNFTAAYFRDDQKAMFDQLTGDLGVTMFRVVPYFVGSEWEVVNDNADPHAANWAYYDERYSNPVFEAAWKALRDLNARGIRPVIALMGAVPPWMVEPNSPAPAHAVCTPNSAMGRLNPAMYEEFAETVATLAVYARRKAGIAFDYFSPVNETDCYPGEGPRIDPADMPKVLGAVARRLAAEGLGDIRLVAGEQALIQTDYARPILADKQLMTSVGALALHTYGDTSLGAHVQAVRESGFPNTPVWLTEFAGSDDLNRTEENEWRDFSIASLRRALTALNQGATAVFYFNAFDDYEECMKRHTYFGLFTSAGHVYQARKRYYAMKQLYGYVKPGARRVEASAPAGVTAAAFLDNGRLTLVGVKQRAGAIRVLVPAAAPSAARWDLIVTSREFNCRKTETLEARDGLLEFDLPEEALFTLVQSAN